jgi:hypothetical protein
MEVLPVIGEKRIPPLLEGFEAYWRAAQTPGTPANAVLTAARRATHAASTHDTHPSLAERLAALGRDGAKEDSSPTALTLLEPVAAAEEAVLRALLVDARTVLTPVSWDRVADEVWLPHWRQLLGEANVLGRFAPRDLPRALADWERIAAATRRGPAVTSPEAERRRVTRLLSAWLTVKLADAGFRVSSPPGVAVRAERDACSVAPHAIVEELAKGDAGPEWARLCEVEGLGARQG